MTQPGFRIEPVSIVRRAPPAVSHSLVSSNPRRTKQSSSLSRSTNERRSPESCSSFRSSEEPYAGFATVAFGCLRRARLGCSPSVPRAPRLWHASVCRTEARKTAPRPSLMKLFKLLSQGCGKETGTWDGNGDAISIDGNFPFWDGNRDAISIGGNFPFC